MTAPVALRRKEMGTAALIVVAATASALLVVLLGSIPATYATTGVAGLPLLFLLVGAAAALLSVGYTAMAKRMKHAAVYYAAIAHGLGRPMGSAAGFVALLSYNAIIVCQYGLFGFTANDLFAAGPWWLWALIPVAGLAVLGTRRIASTTVVLGVILGLQLLVLIMFNVAALGHPEDGSLSSTGFTVGALTGGLGGATAYAVASLFGFELPGSFEEEAWSRRSSSRAVFITLGVLVGIYAVTAYSAGSAAGLHQVASLDPYAVLKSSYGPLMVSMPKLLLLFSIGASMLAFHTVAARYGFAMARDGVIHHSIAHTGKSGDGVTSSDAPVGGSRLQTVISLLGIAGFALAGADPMAALFAWLSAAAAFGLLALLILTSLAAIFYLPRRGAETANIGTRLLLPILGVFAGGVLIYVMVVNLGAMIGSGPGSATMRWLIPVLVVAVGAAGFLWAGFLRIARPDVYLRIGRGQPDEFLVVDRALAGKRF